jgi:hypothetical protein
MLAIIITCIAFDIKEYDNDTTALEKHKAVQL